MLLRIMLTNYCSNDCQYCFVKKQRNYNCIKDIDMALLKKQILEVREKYKNVNAVEIIGGEPLDRIDLLIELIAYLYKLNMGVSLFTSLLNNVDQLISFINGLQNKPFINISYDGKYSIRNRYTWKTVYENIKKLKDNNIKYNIRWSINQEDICNTYEHFLELIELGVTTPIFFPMKYFDYTDHDICVFTNQLEKILDYSYRNKINFLSLFLDGEIRYNSKDNFSCCNEMCITNENKYVNCYVSYTSSNYNSKLSYKNLEDLPLGVIYEGRTQLCENCIEIFGSCNKCIGNLWQYRNLTGKDFYTSYCKLMNRLSELFISFKIKRIPNTKIVIRDKYLFSNIIENTSIIYLDDNQ